MITQQELHKELHYDPATGIFQRRLRRSGITLGKEAGSIQRCQGGLLYRRMMIRGRVYLAHRLAFLFMVGVFPVMEIDHIDGNGLNNRWNNLRQASKTQNNANSRRYKSNTSGFKGVSFHSPTARWQASIAGGGKRFHLGLFSSPEAAHAAYIAAARRLFGKFARAG